MFNYHHFWIFSRLCSKAVSSLLFVHYIFCILLISSHPHCVFFFWNTSCFFFFNCTHLLAVPFNVCWSSGAFHSNFAHFFLLSLVFTVSKTWWRRKLNVKIRKSSKRHTPNLRLLTVLIFLLLYLWNNENSHYGRQIVVNLSVSLNYRRWYLFHKLSRPSLSRVLCGTPAHVLPSTPVSFNEELNLKRKTNGYRKELNTLQTRNTVSVNPVDHTAYKVHIFISGGTSNERIPL